MTKEEKNKLTRDALRHWYENHQEEYCNFTDLMHDRRGIGFDGSSRKHGAYVKLGN